MGDVCKVIPKVQLPSGTFVESKLYQKLWDNANKDRKLATLLYALSKDQSFRNNNGFNDESKQDEFGEPDYDEFISTAGVLQNDTRVSFLERQINAIDNSGKKILYSFEEATKKIVQFNSQQAALRGGYIATLSLKDYDNDEWELSITRNTYTNQKKLLNTVKRQNLKDRFTYYLNRLGVTYSLKEDWDESVIDGFYNLVRLDPANPHFEERTLDEQAAYKCGEFAIATMDKNPVVRRLLEALTPEVREMIYKKYDNYRPKSGEQYGTREDAAAFLLGNAIINRQESNTYLKNWVNRSLVKVAGFFSKLAHLRQYKTKEQLMREVGAMTRSIVKDFTSLTPDVNVAPLVAVPEITMSFATSKEQATFTSILQQIKITVERLHAINPMLAQDLEKYMKFYAEEESFKTDEFGNSLDDTGKKLLALDRIATTLYQLHSDLEHVMKPRLEAISKMQYDPENPMPWLESFNEHGELLRSIREQAELNSVVLQKAVQLKDALLENIEDKNSPIIVYLKKAGISDPQKDFRSLINNLESANANFVKEVVEKEAFFYAQFLTHIEGGEQIQHSARILFNTRRSRREIEKTLGDDKVVKKTYAVAPSLESIKEILGEGRQDISLFSQWVASMSNNEDIQGVLIDKQAKMCQKTADDKCYKDADYIIKLREEGVKLGFSHDLHELIELDDEGIPTGNFLQQYNYGKWEDDFEEFKRKTIESKEFQDEVKKVIQKSHIIRGEAYRKIMDPKIKAWHKEHSKIKEGLINNEYTPNDSYLNSKWTSLSEEKQKYIQKWIDFKREKEKNIHGARAHRLPQMSGATVTTLSQHISREGLFKGISSAVFPRLRTAIVKRLDPQEFGTDATYNRPLEDPFDLNYRFEIEKIHRLPVYGVNKYNKDDRKKKLSTNIVNTMLAYCVMANTYDSFYGVVNALEVGRKALIERDKTINKKRDDYRPSKAYFRFDKFMDKQIYNINTAIIKNSQFFTGLMNSMNSLAAFMYLGGNLPGGAVNLGTGLINLFAEANVGEFITRNSLLKAEAIFMKDLVPMMMEDLGGQAGIGRGLTKTTLFIDKMNASGDSKLRLSSYEEGFAGWAQRVLNPMDLAMLPYSVGEKMMQGVTYMALAMDTPVINITKDGKQELSNVWKMYDTIQEGKGVNKYTLKQGEGIWIDPRNGKYEGKQLDAAIKHYNTLKEVREYLQDLLTKRKTDTSALVGTSLTNGRKDYQDALYFLGIQPDEDVTIKTLRNTIFTIDKFFSDINWTSEKESNMMDVAREVNNRLHGVYNKQDKTALTNNVAMNMIMVMKNYALGYIQSKFAPDHYSEIFKKDVEGSFVTLAKVFSVPLNKNIPFRIDDALMAVICPYSKAVKEKMRFAGFSEHQYFNMKRMNLDIAKILILEFIRAFAAAPSKDDDEEIKELKRKRDKNLFEEYRLKKLKNKKERFENNEQLWGIIYYMSMRWAMEQESYLWLPRMVTEARSLLALTPAGVTAAVDLATIGKYIITGEKYDKNDPKGKYKKGEKKAIVKLRKVTPYWKSIYWWFHPYEAADSYEYATELRSGTR